MNPPPAHDDDGDGVDDDDDGDDVGGAAALVPVPVPSLAVPLGFHEALLPDPDPPHPSVLTCPLSIQSPAAAVWSSFAISMRT